MQVIYWSDYACPFCYIGEKILKQAFINLHTNENLNLIMKSFELDPTASKKVTSTTPERFALKYGLTQERALARINSISEMGRNAGINFNYAGTRYTNTLDAHRQNLYSAYFTENLELANPDVLINAGVSAGLDESEIKNLLESNKYESEVRQDEQEAHKTGIHSVPFFVIENKYYISGAQSLETMTETLKRGLNINNNFSCGAEGC